MDVFESFAVWTLAPYRVLGKRRRRLLVLRRSAVEAVEAYRPGRTYVQVAGRRYAIAADASAVLTWLGWPGVDERLSPDVPHVVSPAPVAPFF